MAKRYLEISDDIKIPAAELTTQTTVVYGGKGMGKTNLAAVIAEELQAARQRFTILDPVGVSWGLRHGAGGKGAGIDLLILGGLHGDLPIEPTGGAVVADLVADEDQDVLVDISRRADGRMWSNGEKLRFVTEYCTRLYERQGERRRPVLQIIDEAGRFVPEAIPRGADQIAACVGAIEQLVELGRNVGVGVMLITQRSARMKKSVSELAECMVAFRTVGPRSVDAIVDWLGEHVPRERQKSMIEQLRTLDRGQALIVSPGWLQFEGVARIRARRTFDSSSTPTGEERKLAKRATRPDLEKYRERIAATVEKAEASDPSKLQKQVAALKTELARKDAVLAKVDEHTKRIEEKLDARAAKAAGKSSTAEVRTLKTELARTRRALEAAMKFVVKVQAYAFNAPEDRDALEQAVSAAIARVVEGVERRVGALADKVENLKKEAGRLEKDAKAILDSEIDLTVEVHKREPFDVRPATKPRSQTPAPPPRKVATGPIAEDARLATPDGQLKKVTLAFLQAFAQNPDGLTREQAHILAGYQPSGDTSKMLAGLLEHGILEAMSGRLHATEAIDAFGPFEPLPTGAELRRHTLERLPSAAERKILQALFDVGPGRGVSRAEIHERAGLKPSGDTSKAFGKFIKLGWVQKDGSGVAIAPMFFA